MIKYAHSFVTSDALMFIIYSYYVIGFPFHIHPTAKLIIQSALRLIMYAYSFAMSGTLFFTMFIRSMYAHSLVTSDALMFIIYSYYVIGFPFHISPTAKLAMYARYISYSTETTVD